MTPRIRHLVAGIAATLGLSASGVDTWFFVLGLLQTEPDGAAREALIAAGVLMTLGELGSFGIAALLDRERQGLRWALLALGAALLAFKVATMAVTQLALVESADAVADASAARIAELQRTIEIRRAVAADRRELAATQTQREAITAAARTLRQADQAEADIEPLAAELAQLQAARRPTLTTLLGADNTALYATLRSALIGLIGVVFMSVAGAMCRTEGAEIRSDVGNAAAAETRHATAPAAHAPADVRGRPHTAPAHREPRRIRARDRPASGAHQPHETAITATGNHP